MPSADTLLALLTEWRERARTPDEAGDRALAAYLAARLTGDARALPTRCATLADGWDRQAATICEGLPRDLAVTSSTEEAEADGMAAQLVTVAAELRALLDEDARERLGAPVVDDVVPRACTGCGCTDDDCARCVAATGGPCWWVGPQLCSRCADDADEDPVDEVAAAVQVARRCTGGTVVERALAALLAERARLLTRNAELHSTARAASACAEDMRVAIRAALALPYGLADADLAAAVIAAVHTPVPRPRPPYGGPNPAGPALLALDAVIATAPLDRVDARERSQR